ncbi:hypothetical protein Tco_0717450 [Tanacetum coccineum]
MYKLKKALGLKQAPHTWYDMLSSFQISQDFSKGLVDPTLFILDTPMVEKSKLDEDKEGKAIDLFISQPYSKDSSIALTAFADADHAGCQDTRRSTSGSMQFLGDRLYQLADIFTKDLARERIEFLINKLGMRSFTLETLKQLADEVDD